MCMHINSGNNVGNLLATIAQMDERELHRLQAALDRRRGTLKKEKKKQSTVTERREYRNGVLQLEGRAYRRKKDGQLKERGPYWYFHYREGGKQRTLYLGKSDNPEAKVDEIMERRV
jgi:hypothetical protein